MTLRRFSYLLFLFISVEIVYANDTEFDFSSSVFQEGSVVVGQFEQSFGKNLNIGLNFYEQTIYSVSKVDNTALSTQYNEFQRKETEIFVPFEIDNDTILDSWRVSLNYVDIAETNQATFVLVDELGEFGTDYTNNRTTRFFSPRIGLSLVLQEEIHDFTIDVKYSGQISPFYYFYLQQNVHYDYTDREESLDPLELENSMGRFAAPYITHNIKLQLGKFFRLVGDHTYQYLPYKNIQFDSTGYDVIIADDPVHLHGIRFIGALTIPIENLLSINLGFGQNWNISINSQRTGADQTNIKKEPYFNLGLSLN